RRLIRSIIEDDCNHDHFPGYRLHITDEDIAVFKPKTDNIELFASQGLLISGDARERCKALARGWDIDQLEIEWRTWVAAKKIKVTNPDKLFTSFCKQRGPWKPGR
ncbi:MAG: plasmid replication initiator RepA, partial [Pseudomonadota bacterium]